MMATKERKYSLTKDAFNRLIANKLAMIGLIVVALLILIALIGPFITPYDFLSQDLMSRNQPPTSLHWFGTDDLGRDVLSRVIYGARTAVLVAFSVTILSFIIGTVLGSLAGYLGGKFDSFVSWLIDITMSIPSLLLVIVINVSLKPTLVNWMDAQFMATHDEFWRNTIWVDFAIVFGSLALIKWPKAARIIRGQILSIRNKNYVMAAKAIGVPTSRILTAYVIPNAIGPIIVSFSATLGEAMVLESSFSFLGVGVRPPIPSWGNMISDGLRVWQLYPHVLAAPALVLAIATIAFSFLGDGLNDALNPRQWK
ncbi:MAG: peptide ABC transporter [Treponema sp. GWB1_62_6]|nr:MAG: peptide ABC transporter [Treponema sp. GWA1_62_8]OHE63692.1 MAG: peptide ABC transporter [Treponema sp. GWB1_62_6]